MSKRRPPKTATPRPDLVEARSRQGLSQADIADRFGMTQAGISHWETGESTPSPAQWKDVAKAYGVSVNKLIEIFGVRASA